MLGREKSLNESGGIEDDAPKSTCLSKKEVKFSGGQGRRGKDSNASEYSETKRVLILSIPSPLSTPDAIAFLSPSICSNNHILGGMELELGRTLEFF